MTTQTGAFQELSSPARRGTVRTAGEVAFSAGSGVGAMPQAVDSAAPSTAEAGPARGAVQAVAVVPTFPVEPAPPVRPPIAPSTLAPLSPYAAAARKSEQHHLSEVAGKREFMANNSSPYARGASDSDRPAARSAYADMHAVKVVSRLVQAISVKPGSGVPNAVKSAHMSALLRSISNAAARICTSIAPTDAHRGWARALATDAALQIVADQWERDKHNEVRPIESQIETLEGVFRAARDDQALRAVLDDLGEKSAVKFEAADEAQEAVALSARFACWDLLGHVNDARLGMGAYRFTFGKPAAEIVERLMSEIYPIVRDASLRTNITSVKTAHLQGALRRVANLVGTEYASRTRELMDWIAEEGIPQQVHESRKRQACQAFDDAFVPQLVDWARTNFLAIEGAATRLMDNHQQEQRSEAQRQSS